jgi:hypothetical protein
MAKSPEEELACGSVLLLMTLDFEQGNLFHSFVTQLWETLMRF